MASARSGIPIPNPSDPQCRKLVSVSAPPSPRLASRTYLQARLAENPARSRASGIFALADKSIGPSRGRASGGPSRYTYGRGCSAVCAWAGAKSIGRRKGGGARLALSRVRGSCRRRAYPGRENGLRMSGRRLRRSGGVAERKPWADDSICAGDRGAAARQRGQARLLLMLMRRRRRRCWLLRGRRRRRRLLLLLLGARGTQGSAAAREAVRARRARELPALLPHRLTQSRLLRVVHVVCKRDDRFTWLSRGISLFLAFLSLFLSFFSLFGACAGDACKLVGVGCNTDVCFAYV